MNESKPTDSGTWTYVVVAVALLGCLAVFVCGGLAVMTLAVTLPSLVEASATPAPSLVPDEPVPVASMIPIPTITAAPTAAGVVPLRDSNFVGLWQYPDRWVWIKITPQGEVFQCRIATDQTVYRSQGILVQGDQIIWEEIWGVDTINRGANSIILDGKYGKFEYEPAKQEMDPVCGSPF